MFVFIDCYFKLIHVRNVIDRNSVGLSLYELSRILDTRIQFQVREYRRRFHAFLSQSKVTDKTIERKIQELVLGGGGKARHI